MRKFQLTLLGVVLGYLIGVIHRMITSVQLDCIMFPAGIAAITIILLLCASEPSEP